MQIPVRAVHGCFRRVRQAAAMAPAAGLLVHLACGGGSPTAPTPPTSPPTPQPTLTSVAPATGSTAGGTTITVTGTNFTAGAAVTVGGTAATGVVVDSATSLRAVTPAHAAGAADVVATFGTLSAALPGGYTYVAPPPNTPPVITGITVQGGRANMPANFADLNEEVTVTAAVTDAETPVDQLTYEWSANVGSFSGTGRSVKWKAPSQGATPLAATITLRVTETWAAVSGAGFASAVQSVTGTASVDVHDSVKEITDVAYDFLLNFSKQTSPPEYVVRNFYSGCQGADAELADVKKNQEHYLITSYRVAETFPVAVNFNGTCPYRSKDGDACAFVPVEWHSVCTKTFDECTAGQTRGDYGTDQVSLVFRQHRWWLCDSAYDSTAVTPTVLPAFKR